MQIFIQCINSKWWSRSHMCMSIFFCLWKQRNWWRTFPWRGISSQETMNVLLRLDWEEKDQLYLLAYGQTSLMMKKTKCLAIKGQNLFVLEPKDAQLQKGFLPCWSFYIQLWDLVAAPGFWAPQDHQSVRWSHFTQTQVQRVIQTSWQVRRNISIPAESYTRPGHSCFRQPWHSLAHWQCSLLS